MAILLGLKRKTTLDAPVLLHNGVLLLQLSLVWTRNRRLHAMCHVENNTVSKHKGNKGDLKIKLLPVNASQHACVVLLIDPVGSAPKLSDYGIQSIAKESVHLISLYFKLRNYAFLLALTSIFLNTNSRIRRYPVDSRDWSSNHLLDRIPHGRRNRYSIRMEPSQREEADCESDKH